MFVYVLFALVSVAVATGPCCPPRQWEGNLGLTMGTYNIKNMTGHYAEGMMRTSFDADRRMVVSKQQLQYDGQSVLQTVINDYNTIHSCIPLSLGDGMCRSGSVCADCGTMYLVTSNGCTASKLDQDLPFCIPSNATQTANVNFGFGDNLVNADSFEVKYQDFTMYIAVTSDTCIPVTEAIMGLNAEGSLMESLHYSGMMAGVADASVFNIPSICTNVPVQPALPGVGRRRSIFA